jgi:hypothetical protein
LGDPTKERHLLRSSIASLILATAVGASTAGVLSTTHATAATPPEAAASASALPAPTTSHHYLVNVGDATRAAKRWGFSVIDTGHSREEIRALPKGTQALVWLGQDCPTPADHAFKRIIRQLGHNSRVFGYYLTDEPDVSSCPHGPRALASRAQYIRKVSGGKQQSFIVMSDSDSYHAYRPRVTRVSMLGLDPYPCSVAHPKCDFTKIKEKVDAALAAGIPLRTIVPVYEAFGQEKTSDHYYNLPTAAEMTTMLQRWAALVPHPRMDYAYSWGHQGSANPTLRDSASLKQLFRTYFAG